MSVDDLTARMSSLGAIRDVLDESGENRNREFRENPRHEDFLANEMLGQLKALKTAMAIPLMSIVSNFDGEPRHFRKWVKEIERYAQVARIGNTEIPQIAHITCAGSVADFVKRYLNGTETGGREPIWHDLHALLKKRFAEISDQPQVLAILRKIRQKDSESVQMFAERFLSLSEDAYPDQINEATRDLIKKTNDRHVL